MDKKINIKKIKIPLIILSLVLVIAASVLIWKRGGNVLFVLKLQAHNVSGGYDSGCFSAKEVTNLTNNFQPTPVQLSIISGAEERTKHHVIYVDKYYGTNGGKPPDNEGVCTDLFWRALANGGIDFQNLLYQDMSTNVQSYPLSLWRMTAPNKSIDFRRVPNIKTYLDLHSTKLPTSINRCDKSTLINWQAGDIVIFQTNPNNPPDHIAIISAKRDGDGTPYIIHNYGFGESEDDNLLLAGKIVGHYRW